MTSKEKEAMLKIAENIEILASLEKAKFGWGDEEDAKTKKTIRPYMIWFENCAMHIKDLVNAENKYEKERAYENIIYNRY